MIFTETNLKDAWIIDIERHADERGYFARSMCREEFAAHGIEGEFVQQNISVSARAGTIRGMHYQMAPHAEGKLVRCSRGRILDVIVDLRRDSQTYLQHAGVELSADAQRMLFVPKGFAHGFQTLTDDVEVTYLVTAPYTPAAERGLRYDDPALGIEWPLPASSMSPKDASWPLLSPGKEPGEDA